MLLDPTYYNTRGESLESKLKPDYNNTNAVAAGSALETNYPISGVDYSIAVGGYSQSAINVQRHEAINVEAAVLAGYEKPIKRKRHYKNLSRLFTKTINNIFVD